MNTDDSMWWNMKTSPLYTNFHNIEFNPVLPAEQLFASGGEGWTQTLSGFNSPSTRNVRPMFIQVLSTISASQSISIWEYLSSISSHKFLAGYPAQATEINRFVCHVHGTVHGASPAVRKWSGENFQEVIQLSQHGACCFVCFFVFFIYLFIFNLKRP